MGQLVEIHDGNYDQFIDHTGSDGEQRRKGLVPRNWETHPQGCFAVAPRADFPLIDESEWDDRIAEQEKNQSSLQHIRDRGNNGQRIPSYDQNGRGYCWAHSSCSAVTLVRACNNQPFVPLSAYMVACIIKGYRDEGGYGAESLEFIAKNGIPSAEFWPMQSTSRSNDNANMRANAAQHKAQEWWDLAESGDLVRKQLATCLLSNMPVIVDYDWWSHSICAVRLVKRNPFTIRIWNSWGDEWSDAGMGDLVGNKAIPQGAWAARVMTASTV